MMEAHESSVARLPTVGVLSIATNRYADYWMDMARTADRHLFLNHDVVMTVFTDRVEEIERFRTELDRVRVHVIAVKALGWPDAPLAKFNMIARHRREIEQDILMYLDADMRVVAGAGADLDPNSWHNGIALVRHPGFRRPPSPQTLPFYMSSPSLAIRDVYRQVVEGGRGTWERDQRSRAYVAPSRRRIYFCGATWMGRRRELIEATSELAARVEVDSRQGIIARFHDESHLNWYASQQSCSILDSDYCFIEGAGNLSDLTPRIIAVEKYGNRTR